MNELPTTKPPTESSPLKRILVASVWAVISGVLGIFVGTAFIIDDSNPDVVWAGGFGLVFGTMFGHAGIAGIRTVLGPGTVFNRLLGSSLWLACNVAAFVIGCQLGSEYPGGAFFLLEGLFLIALWLVAQIPFWLLLVFTRVRLRHVALTLHSHSQIGLRELLILFFVFSVMLAAVRSLFTVTDLAELTVDSDWVGFGIVILGTLMLVISLMPALLVPIKYWQASGLTCSFVIGVTIFEMSLLNRFDPASENLTIVILMNITILLWSLVFSGILRWGGFRLGR